MDGEVVLITGAGRREGLGCAAAKLFAERGASVVVTARDLERAEAVAADVGGVTTALRLDVTDADSVLACIAAVEGRHGRLDVLINNAAGGFDPQQSVLDADLDLARQAHEVMVLGAWRMVEAALPLLRAAPAGRIVNVSAEAGSLTAENGLANHEFASVIPGYAIAKAGLNGLTVKLAAALADTDVLVNAVCPGETATHPEMGDEQSARPALESAEGVVWAATLPAGGPSGGFFRDGEPLSM